MPISAGGFRLRVPKPPDRDGVSALDEGVQESFEVAGRRDVYLVEMRREEAIDIVPKPNCPVFVVEVRAEDISFQRSPLKLRAGMWIVFRLYIVDLVDGALNIRRQWSRRGL